MSGRINGVPYRPARTTPISRPTRSGGGRSGKGCLVAVLALPALPAAMSAIALIARSAS